MRQVFTQISTPRHTHVACSAYDAVVVCTEVVLNCDVYKCLAHLGMSLTEDGILNVC